jgi:hypothetical protein
MNKHCRNELKMKIGVKTSPEFEKMMGTKL